MAERSTIEWTDATWTPVRASRAERQPDGNVTERLGWHCETVSEGCRNCYAQGINKRLGTRHPFKPGHLRRADGTLRPGADVSMFLDMRMLAAPLRWREPRRIFVCSMTDLFADFVPDAWIDQVFAVMALAPRHTFQVLTKRPERMRAYMTHDDGFGRWGYIEHHARRIARDRGAEVPPTQTLATYGGRGLPNVWLGTSAEDQAAADARIPQLLATPAEVRFLSAEPLLGPVDLRALRHPDHPEGEGWFIDALAGSWGKGALVDVRHGFTNGGHPRLDWVIAGGESGPGARPMHPDWARSLRDQCNAAGVAFCFKQWGEWAPATWGTDEDDRHVLYQSERVGGFNSWSTPVFDPDATEGVNWRRLGKKRAGRLLDGRTWDGVPA